MAPTPRPEGWKGGSEDFTFVDNLHGHVSGKHEEYDDQDEMRHGRTVGEFGDAC